MNTKKSTKKRLKHQRNLLILISILLIIINFLLIVYLFTRDDKEEITIFEVPEKTTGYKPDTKYYQVLDYSKFKKLSNTNKVAYIAIININTSTHNRYIELINMYSYKENQPIYLLELNKLSKKELKKYYDLDQRFSLLTNNYFITIKNNEVLTLTEFQDENINILIDNLGIEE